MHFDCAGVAVFRMTFLYFAGKFVGSVTSLMCALANSSRNNTLHATCRFEAQLH